VKPVSLPPSPPPGADPAAQFAWIRACLQIIERASQEEPAQISTAIPPTCSQLPRQAGEEGPEEVETGR
jgi:hypothetical protein